MKKAFEQIRKHWLSNLITFLVSLMVGAGIFLAIFFTRNHHLKDAADGLSVAAIIVLFSGLLCWVAFLGVFDAFAFGTKQIISTVFARDPRRDGTFTDYKIRKSEARAASSYYYISIIAAGLILAIAMTVVLIIYKVSL